MLALLAAVNAQHHPSDHATSSQSIIRHDISHNGHGHEIQAVPVAYHHAPIAHHAVPITNYGSNIHVPSISHHATPAISVHHAAPVVYHSAPIHNNQHGYGHEHQDYHVS